MADVKPEVARALTNEDAFNAASPDVQAECWIHIQDAIDHVRDAPTPDARKAMLAKLPAHIRARVEEWVRQLWNVEVVASYSGDAEIRHLPLCGVTALVRKKGA